MSKFIESLKRLYQVKHFITEEYLLALVESGKITEEEYAYIIAE